jgi:hypothetical protein
MFEITIKADTHDELVQNLLELATGRRVEMKSEQPKGDAAPKPRGRRPATTPTPADTSDDAAASLTADEELTGDDALDAPAAEMPEGADAIVDAGTGQPVAKKAAKAKDDAPIQMTMDDVKVAAAKLAAKDTPALAGILKKYDAPNLSGVPKEKLGDFAADVMEALG